MRRRVVMVSPTDFRLAGRPIEKRNWKNSLVEFCVFLRLAAGTFAMTTYSRSLDEILGFTPPVAARRRISQENGALPIKNLVELGRPSTRHGRSSESSSSGGSGKFPRTNLAESKIDVWSRDEEDVKGTVDPAALLNALEARRPPPIPEQTDDFAQSSSTTSTPSEKQEAPVIHMQRPSLSTLRSSSSSTRSSTETEASNRTHDASVDPTEDQLDGLLRLSSSSSSSESKQNDEQTIVEPFVSVQTLPDNGIEQKTIKSSASRPQTTASSKSSPELQPKVLDTPPPKLQRDPKPRTPKLTVIPSNRPSARSTTGAKPLTRRPLTSNNSATIRRASAGAVRPSTMLKQTTTDGNASFNLWLQRKTQEDKQRRIAEKTAAAELAKKKEEQKANAARAFAQWSAEYDRKRSEETRKLRRQKEEEKRKKEAEKQERRKAAEMSFSHWREVEAERRQTERQRRARAERARSESIEAQKREQKTANAQAYRQWSSNSYSRLRDAKQRKVEENEKEAEKLRTEREIRDLMARDAYDLWLEMKRKEQNYSHSLTYKILNYDAEAKRRWPTPWIPSNPTVTRKFVGTGNRRRTLEKPLDIVKRRARSNIKDKIKVQWLVKVIVVIAASLCPRVRFFNRSNISCVILIVSFRKCLTDSSMIA
ncbi:Microtubule-associated protein 9 [Aphelenchoides besseyi]|nr:Microtubule-associated protein 9 [Aphelenchoides besseyi]